MTILIKGMEMPENCYLCRLGDQGLGIKCRIAGETYTNISNRPSSRPSWCPLIEVPTPHGRLIDINDVKNTKFAAENINQYERWWNGALDSVIENAPTVIEAENEADIHD